MEAQETARQDGHRVLAVGDARKRLYVGVDVVSEILISDARHAIYEGLELGAGREVEGQVNGV